MASAGVEVDGLVETLSAFKALEADLRKEANSELRVAARQCATVLAGQLARAAAGSGVPVAPRVARSIKVKSDRIPVVMIGGGMKVGARGASAAKLVWGSEQGPKGATNHWGVPPSAGYWIAPTVQAFQGDESVAIFKRAIVDLQRRHGLI